MAKIQSVEPNIADLANGWLKSYKLDYCTGTTYLRKTG